MAEKYKSKWIIEYVTDAEKIYAAIRYLEPEPRTTNESQDGSLMIAVIFAIVMLGFAFLLLYR
jgi:hypothetical protein